MTTKPTAESARNDSETPRTPGAWVNQVRAYLHETINVNGAEAVVADTAGSTAGTDEYRVLESEPTYTDLFNDYTKLELPGAR